MRLLHTSDWHLGRSFHGVGMLDAQRSFVDQLVSAVTENAVDVVLIAGDVYDRALPGVDVVGLLDDALVRLTGAGAKVVLTSGNHDSAIRLGFASRLLERGGVHLRTRLAELDQPLLLPLDGTAAADAGAAGAMLAIYGIPWLEPRLVAEQLGVETASHFEVTRAATDLIRADLAAPQRRRAPSIPWCWPTPSPAAASARTANGTSASGEWEPSPWTCSTASATPRWATCTAASRSRRRSGTPGRRWPIPSRKPRHQKGGWLIDVGPAGVAGVTELAWEAPRKLAVLRGGITELLESSDHAWAEDAYCQITLTDAQRPAQAMERLRSRFPDTLVLGFDPAGRSREAGSQLQQQAGRGRGRPLGLLRIPRPRPRPGTPTTPSGRRSQRPWTTCGSRRHRCEDPPPADLRVRALRRHRGNRLRPAQRPRAVPPQRTHRRRQDQRPGRHLLRAVRLGARARARTANASAATMRSPPRNRPSAASSRPRAGTSKSPVRRPGTSPAPAGRTGSPPSRPRPSCANG